MCSLSLRGGDVHTRVVSTIDGAVLCASKTIRASSCVPRVAVEAVRVSVDDVRPSPVGVEHNGTGLGRAAVATSARASLPRQPGVGLGLGGTNLLSAGGSEEGE